MTFIVGSLGFMAHVAISTVDIPITDIGYQVSADTKNVLECCRMGSELGREFYSGNLTNIGVKVLKYI